MKRLLYNELITWKDKRDRKPLFLEGARQVGKTWILKEFGKNEFESMVYLNCDNNPMLSALFYDYDTDRLIRGFSAISGVSITKGKTLIILDEIQEEPKAITAMKYFSENMPEQHIIAAGSLLGVKVHYGSGFPVGKTETLTLFPLSFEEFLLANGKEMLIDLIHSHDHAMLTSLHKLLEEQLRLYYFIGGMPEVVDIYIKTQDLHRARNKQKDILKDYERDFSKHVPSKDLPRVLEVWQSIPAQLAKENKKFVYGAIHKSARASAYENAIEWLVHAGLIHKIKRVNRLEKPVKYFEDRSAFKLYLVDLGLLGAMSNTAAKDVLLGSDALTMYKGSFTEQYVAQQYLSASNEDLFYYTNENSTLELDFVFEGDRVYAIEVKAEINLKAKSLKTVLSKYPQLEGIRFSMAPHDKRERLENIPLPLAEEWFKTCTDGNILQ